MDARRHGRCALPLSCTRYRARCNCPGGRSRFFEGTALSRPRKIAGSYISVIASASKKSQVRRADRRAIACWQTSGAVGGAMLSSSGPPVQNDWKRGCMEAVLLCSNCPLAPSCVLRRVRRDCGDADRTGRCRGGGSTKNRPDRGQSRSGRRGDVEVVVGGGAFPASRRKGQVTPLRLRRRLRSRHRARLHRLRRSPAASSCWRLCLRLQGCQQRPGPAAGPRKSPGWRQTTSR